MSTLYLWRQRTLYLGQIERLSSLSQGAHTLLFGLDDVIPLTMEGQTFFARSYLIPAGAIFSAESQGKRIGCCFLDPLGKDLLFHVPKMTAEECGIYRDSGREADQLAVLRALHDGATEAAEAYVRLLGLVFPGDSELVAGFEPDTRIARVVELIRQDPADNLSNDVLAEQVGLSGDRLQRLFKQATGIPIRRYRLWHRLFVTSSMMAMGSTLTDAAQAAGFSDSSHLTHVFKSMLGMSPSAVLRRSRQVRILVGGDH
ncbi:MAG: helix-turn-helix domain-containing protein [Alcanivorax sp.]|uniref:helix-turn-helix domain-containing protein n=1 Tax=Alcanivorax sp. TaxID=1872427 RepID=UPI003DA77F0C